MKHSFTIIVLFTAFIFLTSAAKKSRVSKSLLITHKWTLVEITQKENDTLTNLTLFLTPCEKDNYIEYADNGKYEIHEGTEKCNSSDNDIKGEGTWLLDTSRSTIIDSYQGGKKIEKKVLTLTDEILKIQYYGEGKKLFTLTYFSEEGQKDETNKDLIVDNSDPAQNITQIIKGYFESTNQHIIVPRKDFQNGTGSNQDDKNGLKQVVTIMPFTNPAKENINTSDRNNQLIAQAKKTNIDYVITGNLINADSKLNDKKEYEGSVKYELFVLDVKSGSVFSDIISDKDEPKKEKAKKQSGLMKTLAKVGTKVAQGALTVAGNLGYGYYGYYGYNPSYYSTYNTLFKAGRIVSAASTTASVFSDVNETLRSQTYNENTATLQAVSKTTENAISFVAEKTATKIKISNIEGSGKKAQIIIEAGTNIGLEKGDVLNVVQITTTTIAGSPMERKEELGEIEIQESLEDRASICSFEDGRDKIIKAFKETPGEVLAVTKLKLPEKK